MTSKHTPLPWMLEPNWRGRYAYIHQKPSECNPIPTIARVPYATDEQKANARLMASAANMYDTLKKIKRELPEIAMLMGYAEARGGMSYDVIALGRMIDEAMNPRAVEETIIETPDLCFCCGGPSGDCDSDMLKSLTETKGSLAALVEFMGGDRVEFSDEYTVMDRANAIIAKAGGDEKC